MLKLMMSVGILLSVSSCIERAPKTETCIIGRAGLQCHDKRTKQTYDLEFIQAENYLCTNPSDYKELRLFAIDLAVKLAECQDRASTINKLGL